MKTIYLLAQNGTGKEAKTYWNRAGVVFEPNRDGSQNFRLDMFPAVKFQIREAPDQQQGAEAAGGE